MSQTSDPIVLTPEQQQQVAKLAERTGRPWDVVLSEALAAFQATSELNRRNGNESFYDAATRLGFIGSVKGGPADLSTNPKYMEGFGKRGD